MTLILLYNVWTVGFPGCIRDIVNRPGDLNRSSASTGPGYLVGLALLLCRVWLRSSLPAAQPTNEGINECTCPYFSSGCAAQADCLRCCRPTDQPALEPASTTHARTHWLRRRSRLRWAGTCVPIHIHPGPPPSFGFPTKRLPCCGLGDLSQPVACAPRGRDGAAAWERTAGSVGAARGRQAGRQAPGRGRGATGWLFPLVGGWVTGQAARCSRVGDGWTGGWMDGWMGSGRL